MTYSSSGEKTSEAQAKYIPQQGKSMSVPGVKGAKKKQGKKMSQMDAMKRMLAMKKK